MVVPPLLVLVLDEVDEDVEDEVDEDEPGVQLRRLPQASAGAATARVAAARELSAVRRMRWFFMVRLLFEPRRLNVGLRRS